MTINVGDRAPEFTLTSDEKQSVSLSDYSGKNLLLLFFPMAFTGVCTEELCKMRDEKEEFKSIGADILAISVNSIFTLAKFKEEQGYNIPLLSDFNKDVSRSYGVLYEDFFGMKGVAKRSAFVIDANGIVQYAEVLESAGDMPDFDAVRKVLAQIGN